MKLNKFIILPLIVITIIAAGCAGNLRVAKYIDRAETYLDNGRQLKAIKDINTAIELDPSRNQTYIESIYLLKSRNLYLEQIRINNLFIKQAESSKLHKPLSKSELAEAYCQNGLAYWDLHKMKEASESFKISMMIDPDNPSILNSLGYLYAEEGVHLKEALALTKRAVKLSPDEAAFIDSLGWVYYKMGRYNDSIRELRKAVELAPNVADLRFHLGAAYKKAGRKMEAKIELEKTLLMDKYMYEASQLLKNL